jgi:phosphatidylglycerophosphate synthase
MTETLVPIALFVSSVAIILGLARIISDGRTRRQLIAAGVTSEVAAAVLAEPHHDAELRFALKWGLTVGAVGIGLILIQFLPYRPDDPISLGLVLVFGAGGLLAYYGAARRLSTR